MQTDLLHLLSLLPAGSLRSRTTRDPAEMTVLEVSNVLPISPGHCVRNPESLGVVPKGNLQRVRRPWPSSDFNPACLLVAPQPPRHVLYELTVHLPKAELALR